MWGGVGVEIFSIVSRIITIFTIKRRVAVKHAVKQKRSYVFPALCISRASSAEHPHASARAYTTRHNTDTERERDKDTDTDTDTDTPTPLHATRVSVLHRGTPSLDNNHIHRESPTT